MAFKAVGPAGMPLKLGRAFRKLSVFSPNVLGSNATDETSARFLTPAPTREGWPSDETIETFHHRYNLGPRFDDLARTIRWKVNLYSASSTAGLRAVTAGSGEEGLSLAKQPRRLLRLT